MLNNITFLFIEGEFNASGSNLTLLPPHTIYHTDNNSLVLELPDGCIVDSPIHLSLINTTQIKTPIKIQLILGAQAKLFLLIDHKNTNKNTNKNIITLLTKTEVEQKKDSKTGLFFLDTGSYSAEHDVKIALRENGASCEVNGLYQLNNANQKITHHIRVEHLAPHCESKILYKGILDKKSEAIFNGKVYVHEAAQQTQSEQANHHLLLSPDASATTRPELEIYADDIKCTHGATVGQLDHSALFYLRARGIPHPEAMQLLIHAFAEQVISQIKYEPIRDYIKQQAGQLEYDEHQLL